MYCEMFTLRINFRLSQLLSFIILIFSTETASYLESGAGSDFHFERKLRGRSEWDARRARETKQQRTRLALHALGGVSLTLTVNTK